MGEIIMGIVPSRVPAGHILQNQGSVVKYTTGTIIISTIYFTYPAHFPTLIFIFPILYNSSWIKPKGQSHPQADLPTNMPMVPIYPRM